VIVSLVHILFLFGVGKPPLFSMHSLLAATHRYGIWGPVIIFTITAFLCTTLLYSCSTPSGRAVHKINKRDGRLLSNSDRSVQSSDLSAISLDATTVEDKDMTESLDLRARDVESIFKPFLLSKESAKVAENMTKSTGSLLRAALMSQFKKEIANLDPGSSMAAVSEGVGIGLAKGIAQGMNVETSDTRHEVAEMPGMSANLSTLAENFSRGLMSTLISGGGLAAIQAKAKGIKMPDGVDLPKVNSSSASEGFARGLISGSGNLPPPVFNDTMSGIPTSFGRGIGEGMAAIGNFQFAKAKDGAYAKPATPGSPAPRRLKRDNAPDPSDPAARSANATGTADPQKINDMMQNVVETLMCEGFGGLAGIGAGVTKSGKIPAWFKELDMNQMFPDQEITFTNAGSTYKINPRKGVFVVNGIQAGTVMKLAFGHGMRNYFSFNDDPS
jgi:hypothetical protein